MLAGRDAANITYVGMGATQGSNMDLRLNTQYGVIDGLRYVAAQHGFALPVGGDLMAIELAEGGRLVRLTLVNAEPLRAALAGLLIPGRSWGWLPAGAVPAW